MRYRPPRNKWGADFAEDYEKNLKDIERDISGVQEQFNQVVIEGDSSVEAAQARVDAKNVAQPTLKARLDKDYNNLTAQLAEKAQQTYVETMLATAVSGAPKGFYNTLAALKSAYPQGTDGVFLVLENGHIYIWNGTTWADAGVYQGIEVGDNRITEDKLAPNSVGNKALRNATLYRNLFDKNKATIGYYIDYSNGNLVAQLAQYPSNATDFIEVEPSTLYTMSYNGSPVGNQVAFYDVNKTYISGSQNSSSFTTPANAKYMRGTLDASKMDKWQIEKGKSSSYKPFGYVLKELYVEESNFKRDSISKDRLKFEPLEITTGKNLVNKNALIPGYYINENNGALVAQNASYPANATDYIKVTPGQAYTMTVNDGVAFYDSEFRYISGYKGSSYKTVTAPTDAVYIRITVLESTKAFFQFELGTSSTAYEDFKVKNDMLVLNGKQIEKESVDFDVFKGMVQGKNLFNKATAIKGYYVHETSGALSVNISPWLFYASDYIPVKPNTQYTRPDQEPIAFYDANKTFISGDKSAVTVTSPANAAYVRVSVKVELIDTYQFEEGAVATSYEPWGMKIPSTKIQGLSTTTPTMPVQDSFKLLLPSTFFVAVGRTLEIYNKQICHTGNINNFHFAYSAGIGIPMGRKWTFTPTASQKGTYTLIVNVYDNNNKLVVSGSTTIKVVDKASDITTKTGLTIGDSLTDIDGWRKELFSLVEAKFGAGKLAYIGTKGTAPYKHEGMSGWKTSSFLANQNYTYGGSIIVTVNTLTTVPQSKKRYTLPDDQGGHVWEVEKVVDGNKIYMNRVTNGTYIIPSTGTMTQVDGTIAGDASITFTSWSWQPGNPFWNTTTNELDFNDYLTRNSFAQPDFVTIYLGANDLAGSTGTYDDLKTVYATSVANLKTMVDKILSQWVNTKIFIILTPFWANQDGMGRNYGSVIDKNEMQQHLKVFTLIDLINTQFKNYNSLVSVVPVAQTMDSDYVYGATTQPVNPRSTITTSVQTGGVHPDNSGFLQMADTIFSHFVGQYQ